MPTVFLSVLAERNKRSITRSNLVSARQNFAARNCCVGAARRVFMILIHSSQFLLQLIERDKLKAAVVAQLPNMEQFYKRT